MEPKYGKMNEPKVVFTSDYYDGPLSGVCIFEDEVCWFEIADRENFDFMSDEREYSVFNLTKGEESIGTFRR